MFRESLGVPFLYELSQYFWYRSGMQQQYVRAYVNPTAGSRILDIGCGTGTLARFCPQTDYEGFDSDPRYIAHASRKYGRMGRFECREVSIGVLREPGQYDIVMANGILHHLPDTLARELLEIAHAALKPGGRLVTRDGCFTESQGPLERWLLLNDRGRHVRSVPEYRHLIESIFPESTHTIRTDMLRLPYSLLIFVATRSTT